MLCPKCGRRIPSKSHFCMYCASPTVPSEPETLLQDAFDLRRCILCGRVLQPDSISDVCEQCLSGQEENTETENFVSDSNYDPPATSEELPVPLVVPVRAAFKRPLIIGILALIFLVGGFLGLQRIFHANENSENNATSSAFSEETKSAIEAAQEMVKAAAYKPDSVYFQQQSLMVSEENGQFTIAQEFERQSSGGETVTSLYEAVLKLDNSTTKGYVPLRLKVDNSILYDNL